ncbi:MAG TPA: GatB/YqeY domain-containing protein [Patescibacteria group bacterium]|nr:GatB/YqeY domain-containing protein [Patescibacteria group bacterium]
MNLKEQIEKDFIEAFKAKDDLKKNLLSMIKSVFKNKEIEIQKPLEEGDVTDILTKEVKKRKESAMVYEQGGRPELVEKENAEAAILSKYLPEQMDEPAVREVVKATITEIGALSPADMGKAIGAVMAKIKGQADGGLVSKIVKEELSK